MTLYRYAARAADGSLREGTREGGSRGEVLASLRGEGLTVVRLADPDAYDAEDALPGLEAYRESAAPVAPARMASVRLSLSDRAVFCRQLAISVSAGTPLRESLESIAEDMDHRVFRAILNRVVRDLHEGRTFSQAVARHPRVFDELFVALIRAAEESGSMAETLERLAGAMEARERLARKIRSIVAYPVFVAVFFCLISIIMTFFVVPQFQDIFTGFSARLPLITRVVFGVNRFILDHVAWFGGGLLLLGVAAALYLRTTPGRRAWDRFRLHAPFFGPCLRKIAMSRFGRNLSIMLRGGVSVSTAMEITSDVTGNVLLREAILAARDRIVQGSDIAASLEREGEFPRLVVRMIHVGESSGRLPEVLDKVADTYEGQVEGAIATATTLFEPLVISLFGGIILVLVLAIYMPIFTVASGVR